jgi:hypothetical protein
MLHSQLAALALAATTLLALSGCGGSSKTQTAGTPTRAEFIAKADAICRTFNAKMNSLKINSQQDFERALPEVASWAEAQSEELNMLTPAAGMEYQWKKFLVGTRIYTEQFATFADYAKTHKVSNSSPLFDKALVTNHKAAEIAKSNGIQECTMIT